MASDVDRPLFNRGDITDPRNGPVIGNSNQNSSTKRIGECHHFPRQ